MKERNLIIEIKKTFGASYATQKRIWDKLEASNSKEELQQAYNKAEEEMVSQSMREMIMRRSGEAVV